MPDPTTGAGGPPAGESAAGSPSATQGSAEQRSLLGEAGSPASAPAPAPARPRNTRTAGPAPSSGQSKAQSQSQSQGQGQGQGDAAEATHPGSPARVYIDTDDFARAFTTAQAQIAAERSALTPTPALDRTVPKGCYLVDGEYVNAWGEKCSGPDHARAKDARAAAVERDENDDEEL